MSTKIIRYFLVILCLTVFIAGDVYAQTQIWPGYHYNAQKTGQNADSVDTVGDEIGLVWVWPKAQWNIETTGPNAITDVDWVVDDSDVTANPGFFVSSVGWASNGLASDEAYQINFLVTNVDEIKTATAKWYLPTQTSSLAANPVGKLSDAALNYKIYVWVPANYSTNPNGYNNSTSATYTIVDSFSRSHTYVLDQYDISFAGGWRLLATKTFSLGKNSYLELSNKTNDEKPVDALPTDSEYAAKHAVYLNEKAIYDKIIVVADAVRFELSTGKEIYASPASAKLDVGGSITPVSYVGTVEPSYGTDGTSPDSGGVYCINAFAAATGTGTANGSTAAGSTLWQYPRTGADLTGRDELEGPIEGGIFSSPTLGYIKDPADSSKSIMALFVTGMDRQVYAFDANGVGLTDKRTPRLLWKGPGITAAEDLAPTLVSGTWNSVTDREDAFGASFLSVVTTNNLTNELSVTWSFPAATRQAAGEPIISIAPDTSAPGWNYNVFVWIPASNGEIRAKDAVYTITYGLAATPATALITVDLSSGSHNEAKWVKLGSYFNVNSVKLSNVSKDTVTVGAVVVADAVMIVPDSIIPFGYCSPVVNRMGVDKTLPIDTLDNKLYTLNAGGRLIAFNLDNIFDANKTCLVDWIYPKVKVSSGSTNEAGMGEMASSASYFKNIVNNYIYLAGMDGNVRCLNADLTPVDNGFEVWTQDLSGTDSSAGFSSSPTLDGTNNQLYLGSIDGQIFARDMLIDGAEKWTYPASGSTDIGAIRFSTAAYTVDSTNNKRIWVGSADGSIYSFDASTGVKLSDTTTPVYTPPGVGAAIQGSVALDKSGSGPLMYTGTMDGRFRWFNANTGSVINLLSGTVSWRTAASQLFSSPNITEVDVGRSYILIGGDDGRLYAFSENINNGAWYGGEWPFEFPIEAMQETSASTQNTEIQMDIFNKDFYDKSDVAGKAEPSITTTISPVVTTKTAPTNPFNINDWIISTNMKLVNGNTYDKIKNNVPATDPPISVPDGIVDDAASLLKLSTDLTTAARERRPTGLFTGRYPYDPIKPKIYFEWGDSIYIIVWNLPPKKQIYGSNDSSKKNSIRFNFVSAAAGVSAGSAMINIRVKTLEEYTVLNKDKPVSGVDDGYEPMYDDTTPSSPIPPAADHQITRCYAIAEVKIIPSGSRPPSPGDGYNLNVEVKMSDYPSPALKSQQVVQLSILTTGTPPSPTPAPQKLGVNNPLGISVQGGLSVSWENTNNPNRHQGQPSDASHINGNPHGIMPNIDLGDKVGMDRVVMHGTSSPQHALGVMDRSAVGMIGQNIDRFRIDGWDLVFRGGNAAIIAKMPWEGGAGSIDYPNIARINMDFRSVFDDKNPDQQATRLPAAVPTLPSTDFLNAKLYQDAVLSQVSVPRYQPANSDGYRRTYNAYVDSDGTGTFSSGNVVLGRPTTFQESYRRFRLNVKVPRDPNIVVEESSVDIGIAGHGLGEPKANIGTAKEFLAYTTDPFISSWFKPLTIKNEGNVNLSHLRVNKAIDLFSDPVNAFVPIFGSFIVSSLDKTVAGTNVERSTPYTTASLGYTLTKPRVGDADPTVLTIPDTRKIDADYDHAGNIKTPFTPKISVRIPVGQPIGTYVNPQVLVYSDWNDNGDLDSNEPCSATSFALKVTVKESQITGWPLDKETDAASRYMVDGFKPPKVSDTTPAAFRDSNGNVNLYWSSNRLPSGYTYPVRTDPNDPLLLEFAGAPWSINKAVLRYDNAANYWISDPADIAAPWWSTSSNYLYSGWPSPLMQFDAGAQVPLWSYGGINSGSPLQTAKHYSPSIARNDVDGTNWLTFAGTASVKKTDNTFVYENRLFYGQIDNNGDIPDVSDQNGNIISGIMSTDINPSATFKYPSAALWGDDMWLFWQSKGAIDYSTNQDTARIHLPKDSSNNALWQRPSSLKMPTALSSISAPNAILRQVWGNNTTAPKLIDVVFAGTNRSSRNSDIMFSRYAYQTDSSKESSPSRRSQPLPRVFNEKLQRDAKYGFYTSNHMSWIRLNTANMTAVVDNWGSYDLTAAVPDLPYVHVVLGEGYTTDNGYLRDYPAGTVVSATDGSIISYNPDGTIAQTYVPAMAITPEFDNATGIATYKYPKPAPALTLGTTLETTTILGTTLVDFSGGIVRFTKPLKELRTGNVVSRTDVYADYTPQTMRLTTDDYVDNSPRAFIEKTIMVKDPANPIKNYNPGLCDVVDSSGGDKFPGYSETVDRLWVLWRKAVLSDKVSTIYAKTYRIGIDLTKITGADPIALNSDGSLLRDSSSNDILMTITNNLGPWEVDRTGTKIYFTGADERYRSLAKYGSLILASPVLPMTISYPYKMDDGATDTRNITVYDVSWIPEVPEHSLFGFASESNVNEGSIYAFADADQFGKGFAEPPSKIWVFWTSTRSGVSNLYWETVTPSLVSK